MSWFFKYYFSCSSKMHDPLCRLGGFHAAKSGSKRDDFLRKERKNALSIRVIPGHQGFQAQIRTVATFFSISLSSKMHLPGEPLPERPHNRPKQTHAGEISPTAPCIFARAPAARSRPAHKPLWARKTHEKTRARKADYNSGTHWRRTGAKARSPPPGRGAQRRKEHLTCRTST